MILEEKISNAKSIIQKAYDDYGDQAVIAWTGGKDSTVLLHLAQSIFDGQVPFPVFFNDSTMEFDEIYTFVKKYQKEWQLDLITVKHLKKELDEFSGAKVGRQKELARTMKISALNQALDEYKWKGLIVGIRWDEHESRSKEEYIVKKKNHNRYHPILAFTEDDVWKYIKKFNVPYVDLYDKGYRSLGEKPFTKPASETGDERSGRDFDKEQVMERLRKLGYY